MVLDSNFDLVFNLVEPLPLCIDPHQLVNLGKKVQVPVPREIMIVDRSSDVFHLILCDDSITIEVVQVKGPSETTKGKVKVISERKNFIVKVKSLSIKIDIFCFTYKEETIGKCAFVKHNIMM